MRIQRTITSHLTVGSRQVALAVVAGSIIAAVSAAAAIGYQQYGNYSSASASGATPEACFVFNSTTQTITGYHDHEGDVATNPACPRDVVIPSSIGGVSVTALGANSFSAKSMTSAYIPDSVTTIGNYAFRGNQLTSVRLSENITVIPNNAFSINHLTEVSIPESVTSIAYYAFAYNSLTDVYLPAGLTDIDFSAFALQNQWGRGIFANADTYAPEFWSSDPAEVQRGYDGLWYARLHTDNPANPLGLDNAVMGEDWEWGDDANENGINDSFGGHIINPASLNIRYVDQDGNQLLPDTARVGQLTNGQWISDYHIMSGPAAPLTAVTNVNGYMVHTAQAQAEVDTALAAYYRVGQQIDLVAPDVSGYTTPVGQSVTLEQGGSTVTFVYRAIALPAKPTVNPVVLGATTVSGNATPGHTVTVSFPGGATATAVAGSDGTFVVDVPDGVELTASTVLHVTATDPDTGLTSEVAQVVGGANIDSTAEAPSGQAGSDGLAATGSDVGMIMLIASVLIAVASYGLWRQRLAVRA